MSQYMLLENCIQLRTAINFIKIEYARLQIFEFNYSER